MRLKRGPMRAVTPSGMISMTALDTIYDELWAERARASKARAALAFLRGVLDTCQRFKQPITPALIAAMIRECNDVLEPETQG